MRHLVSVLPSVLLAIGFAAPVAADVITDWTEKALPIVATYSLGAPAYRDMAMMHVAMFQCVNAIEPLYQPYKGKLEAPPTTSKEAAAAVAAATVLSRLHPPDAGKIEAMRDRPRAPRRRRRVDDAGQRRRERSRHLPPPDHARYGKTSTTRTPQQTETARLWLYTGPSTFMPIAVQLSKAKPLSVAENARLFALLSMATHDAIGAVLEAKYHYEFWRPVTAIRNGDIDGNEKTERDASWEPIGPTPMHPEYPCAHCIVAHAAGTVMQAFFGTGTVPEFTLTTPTAPGVTHRWTRIADYMEEPSNARVWSGIHYRFSTKVGAEMGRKIAAYTLQNALKPVK